MCTNSSCKTSQCLPYVLNAQGRLLFIFLFSSPITNAEAEEFSLQLPLRGGFSYLVFCLLYLSGVIDDISQTKHENGNSKELAHNSLVEFSRITSAFKGLI